MIWIIIVVSIIVYWIYMQTPWGMDIYTCVEAERDLKELKRKKEIELAKKELKGEDLKGIKAEIKEINGYIKINKLKRQQKPMVTDRYGEISEELLKKIYGG